MLSAYLPIFSWAVIGVTTRPTRYLALYGATHHQEGIFSSSLVECVLPTAVEDGLEVQETRLPTAREATKAAKVQTKYED